MITYRTKTIGSIISSASESAASRSFGHNNKSMNANTKSSTCEFMLSREKSNYCTDSCETKSFLWTAMWNKTVTAKRNSSSTLKLKLTLQLYFSKTQNPLQPLNLINSAINAHCIVSRSLPDVNIVSQVRLETNHYTFELCLGTTMTSKFFFTSAQSINQENMKRFTEDGIYSTFSN